MASETLEEEIKTLIVEALALEDVRPGDIDTDAALFGEGLGLDSIDALELAMALTERYGVEIDADDQNNRKIFACVRNLAAHVYEHRTQPAGNP